MIRFIAPTGAGKTDVAMLTILRTIDQYRDSLATDLVSSVRHNAFKIIYVYVTMWRP